MKKLLIFISTLLFNSTFAQTDSSKVDTTRIISIVSPNLNLQSIVNITPPNPDAAALGRYGNIPINLSAGIPDIAIPLYEIKRAVNLNINLSYLASSPRVDDISSMVGLGWSLNAGGLITKTIRGLPDDHSGGIQTTIGRTKFDLYKQNQMTASDRKNYELDVINGVYDIEPDEYFYNFLGNSGKMVFDANGNAFLQNHQNLLVLKTLFGYSITDELGTQFHFTEIETTKPTTYCFDKNVAYTAETAWYLSQIVPLNGKNINFTYFNRDNITYTQGVHQTNRYNTTANQNCSNDIQSPCVSVYRATIKQIQSINFDLGSVEFIYESRADLGFGWYRIKQMEVKDLQLNLIKKIAFEYTYNTTILGTQPERFILKELNDITDLSQESISHKFEYYHFDDLPPRNSTAQDHYGIFNNNTSGNLIPQIPISGLGYNWADREPDVEKSKYGLLTKITYPTKGYTLLEYEQNDYGYIKTISAPNPILPSGGVRIKSMTDIDSYNPSVTRTFSYKMKSESNRSSGIIQGLPVYYYPYSETKYINNGSGYDMQGISI